MKHLEKEIIAVNKKESTERLRSYKKAVADILTVERESHLQPEHRSATV